MHSRKPFYKLSRKAVRSISSKKEEYEALVGIAASGYDGSYILRRRGEQGGGHAGNSSLL